MNNKPIFFAICFLLGCSGSYAQSAFEKPARGFTSWQPAENWEQSLLSGNGTMGAMVTGQPYEETVILSHAALYLPQKRSGKVFDQQQGLAGIKELLLAGKYKDAAVMPAKMREQQGYDDQRDPFIPAFDLKISQQSSNVKNYQRAVNFETGEAVVQWVDDLGEYTRKVFVSRADSTVVVSLKSKGKINCAINFDQRPFTWEQAAFVKAGVKQMHSVAEDNWLIFNSEFNNQYADGLKGYTGVGRLIQTGGTHQLQNGKLVVIGADEVLLLIKILPQTDLRTDVKALLKTQLSAFAGNENGAKQPDYETLLARHVKIHGPLFSQVKLDLGGSAEERNLNSEALILRGNTAVSPALIERVFDAGRYNILSATGLMPPNLQGLWSGTWTSPWSSGFTTDGNLPAAISILLPGHLPSLLKGFFNYHEKMMEAYRKESKQLYGTRGIHIPAQITTRGVETDFGPVWCLTYWTGAAGWTANSFNDYYLYTGDKAFLKDHAYPFMKEAALFYEDFLSAGSDGKLMFIPSYSPENNPAGMDSQVTINATMDVMIAKQLLRNCIAAAKILKTDAVKIALWEKMLVGMPAYEVNEDGALKEWIWEGLKDNYSHRHASQLYALYDGVDADFQANPALVKAAEVLIDKKLAFREAEGGGEMAFGLVQLGTAAAHIGNAVQAGKLLNWLASKYWTKGMGSYHNVKELFNTDISGGLPYLVTQMLCSSEPGVINVLPALPESWEKGEIEGLLLRGQITLSSLKWEKGEVHLIVKSAIDQPVKIKYKGGFKQLNLKAGSRQEVSFKW